MKGASQKPNLVNRCLGDRFDQSTMKSLAAFYRKHLSVFDREDLWCYALKSCFLQAAPDETLAWALFDECQKTDTDSPKSHLSLLRKFASLSFFCEFQTISKVKVPLQQAYGKLDARGFWDEFQIGKALYSLGCYLIGLPVPTLEPKQLTKGGILVESGGYFPDGGIPHLLLNAELALTWLFLGWKLKCEKLIEAALKWAHLSAHFFDHKNRPFHAVWTREPEYSPSLFYVLYFLLFSVSSKFVANAKIVQLAETLSFALEQKDCGFLHPSPVLAAFFSLGFESLEREKIVLEMDTLHIAQEIDQNLGYLLFKQNDLSFMCCFSGVNTGLGALHKTGVCILSFGPHHTPLGDPNRYGIYRTCSFSQPFRDVELVKTSNAFMLKGWTRILSSDVARGSPLSLTMNYPSRQWLHLCAEGSQSKVLLKSRLVGPSGETPLFFAYFVKADEVRVQSDLFSPGSLRQYRGKNREIVFEGGGQTLCLQPHTQGEMYVIPLAGGHHFWGADFLVAFLIEPYGKMHSWEIK